MSITVGIDTGGTFTDLVAVDDESGRWHVAKVPSNPDNPVAAIDASLGRRGLRPGRRRRSSSSARRSASTRCSPAAARASSTSRPRASRTSRTSSASTASTTTTSTGASRRRSCTGPTASASPSAWTRKVACSTPIDLEALGDGARGDRRQRRGAARGRGLLPLLVPQPRARAGRPRRCSRSASRSSPSRSRTRSRRSGASTSAARRSTVDAYLEAALRALRGRRLRGARGQGHRSGTWALLKSNGGHALAGEARARPGAPPALGHRGRRHRRRLRRTRGAGRPRRSRSTWAARAATSA